MGEVAGDIEFDFAGSLRVARELWALADLLSTKMTARETAGAHASTDWLGPHHDDFVTRMRVERINVDGAAPQLRSAAQAWAVQWQQAMDQQNQILMAREWDSRHGDWLHDHSFGILGSGPKRPPDPVPAALPSAPDFSPTRSFYTAANPVMRQETLT